MTTELKFPEAPKSDNARDILATFGEIMTARMMFFYDGPAGFSAATYPSQAAPTFANFSLEGGNPVRLTNWQKASAPGFDPFGSDGLRLPNVPLDRSNLEIILEFILPVEPAPGQGATTQYIIIAYACTAFSDTEVTEEEIRERLAEGMTIYTGRTCGRCPIKESEFRNQDNPDITAVNLLNLQDNPDAIPGECPTGL